MKKIISIFTLITLTQVAVADAGNKAGMSPSVKPGMSHDMRRPVNAEEAMPARNENMEQEAVQNQIEAQNQNQVQTEAKVQTQMEEQSGFSRGSVVRSAFTTAVNEREPTEDLQNLTNENGQVMFFTELRDMSGQTAVHRWQYDGKVVAEVEFKVGGPRWRVWSSKAMQPQWTGEWKVSVVNGAGEVISEKNLNVSMSDSPATTTIENTNEPALETGTPAQ